MEYIKNRKLEKQVGLAFYPMNNLLVPIMSVQTIYTHTFHIFREFEKKSEKNGGGGSWKGNTGRRDKKEKGRRDKKEKGRGEM